VIPTLRKERISVQQVVQPTTIREVLSLLDRHRARGIVKAGGTDVILKMRRGLLREQTIIDMSIVEDPFLRGIHLENGGIRIGALTPLRELERSLILKNNFISLAEAASRVATPQIRNKGTVGGNIALGNQCEYYNLPRFISASNPCSRQGGSECHLVRGSRKCHAPLSADLVPALVSRGAMVRILSTKGERTAPLAALYRGAGTLDLRSDEIITEVEIPPAAVGNGQIHAETYLKHALRKAIDFPLVGVALSLNLDKNMICTHLSIVAAGLSFAPVTLSLASEALMGKKISEELILQCAAIAGSEVEPVRSIWASPDYKKRILQTLVERGLKRIVESTLQGVDQ
jgi:CO/xanthine dehydrogenase FAD-binding subunit